jgi:hypothetical protein
MLGLTQKDPLAETPCQSLLRVVRCVSRRCRCEVVAVLAMAVNGCSLSSPSQYPPCHCTCPLPRIFAWGATRVVVVPRTNSAALRGDPPQKNWAV